jgi:type IV pilus assembly protein PilO
MTYTEEFIPGEGQDLNEASAYPTAFGITFTPTILGVLIAVLGLLGAGYLAMNFVLPALENNKTLQTKVEETQVQIQQKQASQQKIKVAQEKLDAAKQQKKEVLTLFPNEQSLDTLLLDINRFVNARQGKLQSFVPDLQPQSQGQPQPVPNLVNDGSLGPDLDNKVRRKIYTVELEGSFDQIQSILRSIERLQALLLVKDFQAQLDKSKLKIVVDQQGKIVPQGQETPPIKATFKLHALLPLTPEEAAQIIPPPPPPAK